MRKDVEILDPTSTRFPYKCKAQERHEVPSGLIGVHYGVQLFIRTSFGTCSVIIIIIIIIIVIVIIIACNETSVFSKTICEGNGPQPPLNPRPI